MRRVRSGTSLNVHASKVPNHSQLARNWRVVKLAIIGIWRPAAVSLSQSSVTQLSAIMTKYSTLTLASVTLTKKLKVAVLLKLKSAPSRSHLNATASSIQLSGSLEIPTRVKQARSGTKKLATASQCLKFLMKSAHAWSSAATEFSGTNSHADANRAQTIM